MILTKIGKVAMAYNNKSIGFDFSPLGGTAIGVGSNYTDFSIDVEPLAHEFKNNYIYRETNNPNGTLRNSFTRNYDRYYNAYLNPFGISGIGFTYHNLEIKGLAESNVRRQLKRLRDLMIIEKQNNLYYMSEFESLGTIFDDKIHKFFVEPSVARIKEYLNELEK